jgi:LmbE family N-acetylglucosaminyl deacetylase
MGDKKAPGAVEVITEPDFEAMVIGAHPDDDDFGSAGTSALWASQGKKIVWVVMTDGTEGSEVPSADAIDLMLTREQEQRAASQVLGVQAIEFLRFPDGHLQNTEETRKAVVRLLRKYRPRIVITHDPTQHFFAFDPDEEPTQTAYINHPDHRATGNTVLDAIFPAAGNPRSFRELLAEGLQPYRVHELYFFMSGSSNTYINISETIELKAQALKCHTTQFDSDWNVLEEMKKWSAMMAKEAQKKKGLEIEYAEAFRRVKLYVPEVEE